jgi:ABC-2 type transport system permease protein
MLVSVVLIISGFGLILLGVVPGIEEILRVFMYLVISIFYISFWLGIAILFSISFRSIATSLLATAAVWLFLSFFVGYGAPVLVANTVAPVEQQEGTNQDVLIKNMRIKESVSLFSPMILYSYSTAVVVDPTRKTTRLHLMGFAEPWGKVLLWSIPIWWPCWPLPCSALPSPTWCLCYRRSGRRECS